MENSTEPIISYQQSKKDPLKSEESELINKSIELKKTWSDYIFEFSIPFLAVTAAFFLNNEKEAYSEWQLEEQYINSIVSDIQDDIEVIDQQLTFHALRINQMDTLLELLQKPVSEQRPDRISYLGKMATRSVQFFSNDRTIEQMKNSATFRLIRNQKASNQIIDYYQKINVIKIVEERERDEQENFKRVAVKLFDPFAYRSIAKDSIVMEIRTIPKEIINDAESIRELAGYIQYLNISRGRLISLKEDLKKSAQELVLTLQTEYHLGEK